MKMEKLVRDVMTPAVVTISPQASLAEAAALRADAGDLAPLTYLDVAQPR